MVFITLSAHSMVRAAMVAPSLLLRVIPVQAFDGTCEENPRVARSKVDNLLFIILAFNKYCGVITDSEAIMFRK